MSILLDTNVVSELIRKAPDPAVTSWVSDHPLYDLFFSAVSEAELRYVAEYERVWLALIGWQSGAFKCRPRDRWIGWRPREQFATTPRRERPCTGP